ncbi:hypothetical protein [Nocardia australiensis]|uniref:hypothetical protein n=1 Tax=Nocardia australiensis TaxID=2887191 RepID=UPI001D14A285|nr:hypothetical protein [Nocardia australiensis]
MSVRRLIVLCLLTLLAPFAVAACTIEGSGAKSECDTSGCTVTFNRGVNAKVSVLGVDAELVAVDGNQTTLKVGGQEVTVPVGHSQSAEGIAITVQDVTDEKVVVKFSTGLNGG